MYTTADDWKGKVSRYLELAEFVVLIVRSWSEPLLWEMNAVRWRASPNRTIVILVHATHWTRSDDYIYDCGLIVSKGPDAMPICRRSIKNSELSPLAGTVGANQMTWVGDLHARINVVVEETFHPPSRDRLLDGVLALGFEEDWSPIIVAKKIGGLFGDTPKDYLSFADEM